MFRRRRRSQLVQEVRASLGLGCRVMGLGHQTHPAVAIHTSVLLTDISAGGTGEFEVYLRVI